MDFIEYSKGQSPLVFSLRARRDLLDAMVSDLFEKNKKSNILEVGAGTGDNIRVLEKYGDVYATDINKDVIGMIPPELCREVKIADASELPYDDGFFDMVVCFDVLEHIKNEKRSVSEMFRVLKKGGLLFFSVPAFGFLFSGHDKGLGHFRRYSKSELKGLFRRFREVRISYWDFFLLVPISIVKLLGKGSGSGVMIIKLPRFLNTILYAILKIENKLIKHGLNLPVGTSLVGHCRK